MQEEVAPAGAEASKACADAAAMLAAVKTHREPAENTTLPAAGAVPDPLVDTIEEQLQLGVSWDDLSPELKTGARNNHKYNKSSWGRALRHSPTKQPADAQDTQIEQVCAPPLQQEWDGQQQADEMRAASARIIQDITQLEAESAKAEPQPKPNAERPAVTVLASPVTEQPSEAILDPAKAPEPQPAEEGKTADAHSERLSRIRNKLGSIQAESDHDDTDAESDGEAFETHSMAMLKRTLQLKKEKSQSQSQSQSPTPLQSPRTHQSGSLSPRVLLEQRRQQQQEERSQSGSPSARESVGDVTPRTRLQQLQDELANNYQPTGSPREEFEKLINPPSSSPAALLQSESRMKLLHDQEQSAQRYTSVSRSPEPLIKLDSRQSSSSSASEAALLQQQIDAVQAQLESVRSKSDADDYKVPARVPGSRRSNRYRTATAGVDVDGDGNADFQFCGVDLDGNGIPDALEPTLCSQSLPRGSNAMSLRDQIAAVGAELDEAKSTPNTPRAQLDESTANRIVREETDRIVREESMPVFRDRIPREVQLDRTLNDEARVHQLQVGIVSVRTSPPQVPRLRLGEQRPDPEPSKTPMLEQLQNNNKSRLQQLHDSLDKGYLPTTSPRLRLEEELPGSGSRLQTQLGQALDREQAPNRPATARLSGPGEQAGSLQDHFQRSRPATMEYWDGSRGSSTDRTSSRLHSRLKQLESALREEPRRY